MKKLLILIVFGAVYLHYYPQPKLTQWFEQEKTSIMTNVAEATDTQVRLDSKKIFSDLKPYFNHFSEGEIEELRKITAHRKNVTDFYDKYCNKYASNPKIQLGNVDKICKTMSKYQSLF
ncbi:MAG: hypothetical protein JKX78_10510 [Alteromonadaceae bacterium]|nr:hypothetical protein [Alteromonadaceae bacterium]MBL4910427.1 hypothetical protein [Alteromonadaceae bacterium]